jgi:hypothetical protein
MVPGVEDHEAERRDRASYVLEAVSVESDLYRCTPADVRDVRYNPRRQVPAVVEECGLWP